jgi:hypothetical protein
MKKKDWRAHVRLPRTIAAREEKYEAIVGAIDTLSDNLRQTVRARANPQENLQAWRDFTQYNQTASDAVDDYLRVSLGLAVHGEGKGGGMQLRRALADMGATGEEIGAFTRKLHDTIKKGLGAKGKSC